MHQYKREASSAFQITRLLVFVRPYWMQLLSALLATALVSAVLLQYPALVGSLIDTIIVGRQFASLVPTAIFLSGLIVAQALLSFWQQYCNTIIGERIVVDLRIQLYRHLQRLSLSFFQDHPTGDLLSRLTNDVMLVREAATTTLMNFVSSLFLLLIGITVILAGPESLLGRLSQLHLTLPKAHVFSLWNPTTMWVLLLLLLLTLPFLISGLILRPLMKQQQEALGETINVLEETISNQKIVKAFSREADECRHYEGLAGLQVNIARRRAWVIGLANTLSILLGFGGIGCFLWFVGNAVIAGNLTIGDLVMTLILLFLLSQPFASASNLYSRLQMALGAAERIFALLDQEPDIKDIPNAPSLPRIEGQICFSHVHFSYDGQKPVLCDVSLEVEPGQMVALVGPSGAGKTTIANLLLRFFDIQEGKISIDGHDISRVQMESVRRQIGIVLQEPVLFSTTVRENIAYGEPEASLEEVQAMALAANAHHFIEQLPQGYDTPVGERGVKLSVGQRQRIAIARALLRNPRLLILDEATSSLDSENERLVQEAFARLMKGRTTLVIAHRLSTIEHADKIIVLERGRVIEQGTHESLLARQGRYSQLYTTLFREQEA
ncbi:ABC transporter ATP-binding protein [Ktedonosporobacter rubrisoli]|uniref:ABC transporter ATP-binding protein n=1 Tax=Ktedonosporobacter rubrisoli TaxID=2509675 RepID=A0A4P6K1L1_KTERU|nr:ABC transporter ATP-binding protein [Ktedonosporobacter rubrisoli]QBD81969.1 ABC transporter ATP-binding protein [Ktedonosporobacter rubrisoli]